ncbi:MAG: Rieske 2Fe-2S domain-containing protein [Gammaproteobacteria bacterium]|nr:Rieske 2Fe-2S domain-containing protein [Gammaproteobacteria bacterium]NIM74070.1 Rieske 2Fe-2S domain-containing protein [Gammaproteobacteria bacterium]NIN38953.1 Rieske 2Fe-2S domain-containing protein [Gammaproteobacteria bacterium]NIO25846.1 Rieske 2Fe-2S domain-containing protein [Gammaproteobacteria bacterium]NIO66477.1 Rieske 2Fe-2S domain-containing protein [Gammaproteobacteria bacterium]
MSWKRICATGDIGKDELKKFDVDGVPILIANIGDEFRAFPPACPHMEEPLEQSGICQNGVLTCTKHLWQWDMLTGKEQGPAEKPLLMYDVKCDGDDVLVFVEQELIYEYEEEDDDDFEW